MTIAEGVKLAYPFGLKGFVPGPTPGAHTLYRIRAVRAHWVGLHRTWHRKLGHVKWLPKPCEPVDQPVDFELVPARIVELQADDIEVYPLLEQCLTILIGTAEALLRRWSAYIVAAGYVFGGQVAVVNDQQRLGVGGPCGLAPGPGDVAQLSQ